MKKYGWLMKLSLLSISLLPTSAAAIAGAIPLLSKSFPEQPVTMIELLTLLPTITVAIFVVLSIPITKKIGEKNTVIAGLIIALIGGVAPLFLDNFYLILFFRIIFGIGIGLFNSLCFQLINRFFSGEEQTQMLGYQSSFQGLGGASLTFLSGQLLAFGWHAVFFIYLIAIPVLALFALFVPVPPVTKGESQKTTLCKPVIKYVILEFIFMVLYNAIAIKLPSLFVTKGIGTATAASNIYTITQVASMITGLIYAGIYRNLKGSTLPFSILALGIGFLIIAFGNSQVVIMVGALLTGIAFATLVPYLFNKAANISAPSAQALSATLLIVGGQSAGFFAPFILNPLGRISILSNEFAQSFLSAAVILILVAVIVWIIQRSRSSHKMKI